MAVVEIEEMRIAGGKRNQGFTVELGESGGLS
jgi:hypothetical protein